jgi:nucleotide-binding universal stress UspA family protein
MKASKILFPTDFSSASKAVLPLATSLARDMGATLVILHVEEPPMAYGELAIGTTEAESNAVTVMLENLAPPDPNVPVERRTVMGNPATEIVRFADSEGIDLIVMPTHGRSGLSRLLMGSVAELVVRHANCPVLTLKQPLRAKLHLSEPAESALQPT